MKLFDGLVGPLPIIGMFTGDLLHPAYGVIESATGEAALRVIKRPALLEGLYRVERTE